TEPLALTIHHHSKTLPVSFPPHATLQDLAAYVEATLSIPPSHQKYLITPKTGLLKPPFAPLSLADIAAKKITLMGSTPAQVAALSSSIAAASAPRPQGPIKAAKPAARRDARRAQADAAYTFHTLRPLGYLPGPERSLRFLERLRDDPGVRAAMRRHEFSVGLLTEMDPAMHTTHESRTLGLNRNRGEVIELRLRTDAYDGYRDYKTIRKTLCHELAHNVWGEHDRNFWNLCKEIEGEVERGDWTRGGRSVGEVEFYNPEDRGVGDEVDGGGWEGGEYVLGGMGPERGMSRREVLAQAVERRLQREKEERERNG
ncbi:WLM-domain-containing protein, partial [Trichodelitschia bisporula]